MRLKEVFHAAVTPDGELLQGSESQTNGLYTSPGKAQGILTKRLNWAVKCVEQYRSELERGISMTEHQHTWYTGHIQEVERLNATRIKRVKVVLVE
jgi:hypothetical protein